MGNENTAIKPIIIRDEEKGAVYTLEYSRETVKWAESRGFDISDVERFPMIKFPELFYYAFRMHHRNISRQQTDKILDEIGGISKALSERLGQLYAAPYTTLFTDDEETPKNAKMTVEL